MRSLNKHKLWDADVQLFDAMRDSYKSENERKFFEYLFDAEQWDCCLSGELLLHESDNGDKLYILREYFDEYEIGQDNPVAKDNIHFQGLAQALSLNLHECGFCTEDITLLQWLKRCDYAGIRYDQNYDYLSK